MVLLTDAQLHAIRELIRDQHSAFVVNTVGPEAVSPELLEKLQSLGLVDIEVASIEDAYLYGHALAAALDPRVANMTLQEFKRYLRQNPVKLSEVERRAIDFAKHQAAQFAVGLGNKIDTATGQLLIEADARLRAERRDQIRSATAEALAKRKAIKELVSDLQWATKDWQRDWDRIAVTEKHNAMQRGVADSLLARYGDGVLVAKRPTPDACKSCKKLYLGSDGNPLIFKLTDLERNGTNFGRKVRDWLPVIGATHPWCQCQLLRIPQGWGFDEQGDLIPGAKANVVDAAEKSERSYGAVLRKAEEHKPQGHTVFHGIPIAIEQRKGSVRRWTNALGERGETRMYHAYGYVKRTGGADGEEIDVYLGPDAESRQVFIVHQLDAATGRYDECKLFLGFGSAVDAREAYLQHIDDPQMFGWMESMTVGHLKRWVAGTEDRKGHSLQAAKSIEPGTGDSVPSRTGSQFTLVIPVGELRKAGPYIGPRGGMWADPEHTIPWRENKGPQMGLPIGPKEERPSAERILNQLVDGAKAHGAWAKALKIVERTREKNGPKGFAKLQLKMAAKKRRQVAEATLKGEALKKELANIEEDVELELEFWPEEEVKKALVVSGNVATEEAAQTSRAAFRAPGHGTFPNFLESGERTAPAANPMLSHDPNIGTEEHQHAHPDDLTMDWGPRHHGASYDRDAAYYRGEGWPIEQTPVPPSDSADMRGPAVFPGRSGETVTLDEAYGWHPQDEPGITERHREVLPDPRGVYEPLQANRLRFVLPVTQGVHPYTDAQHRATESAERARLERTEVGGRQRPRNTVDIGG